MNITLHPTDDFLEMRLDGRFDAAWADYVGEAIDEAVRGGAHRIALDFAKVTYISSMGIGVLMKYYKNLKAVNGRLIVIRPGPSTLTVIAMSGLTKYLLTPDATEAADAEEPEPSRTAEHGGATYEIYPQVANATFDCTLTGDPSKFASGGFGLGDCRTLALTAETIALGLGAFGENFADCQARYGEFLGVGGCAVTLPTGEQNVPDYQVTRGQLVPKVHTLYAMTAQGQFASMLRFDDNTAVAGLIRLSQLVESSLELIRADAACFAIIAEAAGVIGATLRRSPVAGVPGTPLEFPGVRDWLSFTTERSADRDVVLIVGIAARKPAADLAPFLRPMTSTSPVHGHFHAVVFPYRPVQRGELNLAATVAELVSASTPKTVRHLMADSRPFESVGETEVIRGACWVGPIKAMRRA